MPIAGTRLEKLQLAKLLQSVRIGDRDSVEKLIASGIPNLVNYVDGDSSSDSCPGGGGGDSTALGLAARANADDLVGQLLGLGADPDVVDLMGRTAAMKAAEYGHWQSLERLADAGADMGLTDCEGKGVLFYCTASTLRHRRCANIVLQHKADSNNTSKAGVPIFVHACETARDNQEACLLLLKTGADPSSKNMVTGRTAVMAAALSGSAIVVREILVLGGEVNEVMKQSSLHPAHEASKGGHVDVLQVLSGFGGNFDVKDNKGNSPLHLAAGNGHGLACRFLAQRGCNPKTKNSDGQTARMLAKGAGHKEAVRECRRAEKLFGKSAKNTERWAVALYDLVCIRHQILTEACEKMTEESDGKISKDDFLLLLQGLLTQLPEETDLKRIVNLHLDADGFVDYKDFLAGRKFINRQYLITAYDGKKKKGKRGAKGKSRKTKVPFPICTQTGAERRPDGGPSYNYVNQHVHHSDNIRFGRDDRPRHLIEDDSKWYLDMPGEQYTYISHAVKNADINTLRDTFLEKSIDVDIRDKFYKTPLMIACLYGNMELVKFLVGCGANVTTQDNFKWTPLHFACHSGASDIVEHLLDLGANIETKALNGMTPLMRAIQSNSLDTVQLLLQRGARLRVENRKEDTPLDIAATYGDYYLYGFIKEKWDALPPVKDKRKTRAKRTSARPKSTPASAQRRSPFKPLEPVLANQQEVRQRKTSILRTSSALGGGLEEKEDITYSLINTWDSLPTSRELVSRQQGKRERFGWEVDFEDDAKFPFLRNVSRKIDIITNAESQ